MNARFKTIEISGTKYQLRRFLPDVGSYILMKMLNAGLGNGPANSETAEQAPPVAPREAPSGEELVRMIAFSAFLRGLDYDMHKFIQLQCLLACSRQEDTNGESIAMPIANSSGVVLPDIRDNMELVLRLEVEVLVFNFSDFLAAGGLNTLAGKQAPVAA